MGQKLAIQKTTRSIEKVSNFIVIVPVFIVEFQTLKSSHTMDRNKLDSLLYLG